MEDEIDRLAESGHEDEYPGENWNERQRRFVRLMLRYENGARAAREAGYVPKRPELAARAAYELQKLPHIERYLTEKRGEARRALEITAEDVKRELVKIAFSNLGDLAKIGNDGLPYLDLSDLNRDQLAALSEFYVEEEQENQGTREEPEFVTVRKVRFKMHDKGAALRDLGRFFKMFTDKIEAEITGGDVDRILDARARARKRMQQGSENDPA